MRRGEAEPLPGSPGCVGVQSCFSSERHSTRVGTCAGVTGCTEGPAQLEMKLSTHPRVGSSRGISHDTGMVEISMVFQVLFRVKCTQSQLNMCSTFSDNHLIIDKH